MATRTFKIPNGAELTLSSDELEPSDLALAQVGVIPTILLSSAIMEIVISCQLVKEVARGLAYNRLALTAK